MSESKEGKTRYSCSKCGRELWADAQAVEKLKEEAKVQGLQELLKQHPDIAPESVKVREFFLTCDKCFKEAEYQRKRATERPSYIG